MKYRYSVIFYTLSAIPHLSQDVPYEDTLAQLETFGPRRNDGTKYYPGGSVEGGDGYLIVPEIWDYCVDRMNVKSVLDVGSGEGHASKHFSDKGCLVFAIDKDTECIKNAVYPVIAHDLTEHPFKSPQVDMIYCVEVLEHIPESYLINLSKTIASANPKHILITFAVPGQIGVGHINLQEEPYWVQYFKELGYEVMPDRTEAIRELADDALYQFKEHSLILGQKREGATTVKGPTGVLAAKS